MNIFEFLLNQGARWIIIWFLGMGFYNIFLTKRGFNLVDGWPIVTVYYLIFTLIAYIFFKDNLNYINLQNLRISSFIILSFIILATALYSLIPKYKKVPIKTIKANPTSQVIKLDKRYLVSKSAEILFQQIMIWSLLGLMLANNIPTIHIPIVFGLFFGLCHVPIIITANEPASYMFLIGSFLGGFMFANILLYSKQSIVLSYVFHWSFYLIFGPAIWIFPKLQKMLS